MPSGRGVAVLGTGLGMWVVSRVVGSAGMEVVGDRLGGAAVPGRPVRPMGADPAGHPQAAVRRPRAAGHPGHRATRRRERCAGAITVLVDRGPPAPDARAASEARGLGCARARLATGCVHRVAADARPLPHGAAHDRRLRPVRPDAPAPGVRRARRPAGDSRDRGPDLGARLGRSGRTGAPRGPGSCSARARSTTRCASTSWATTSAASTGPRSREPAT